MCGNMHAKFEFCSSTDQEIQSFNKQHKNSSLHGYKKLQLTIMLHSKVLFLIIIQW